MTYKNPRILQQQKVTSSGAQPVKFLYKLAPGKLYSFQNDKKNLHYKNLNCSSQIKQDQNHNIRGTALADPSVQFRASSPLPLVHFFSFLCSFREKMNRIKGWRPQLLGMVPIPLSGKSLQGLFVPFACVGSGDPVRVLRLCTTNMLGTL